MASLSAPLLDFLKKNQAWELGSGLGTNEAGTYYDPAQRKFVSPFDASGNWSSSMSPVQFFNSYFGPDAPVTAAGTSSFGGGGAHYDPATGMVNFETGSDGGFLDQFMNSPAAPIAMFGALMGGVGGLSSLGSSGATAGTGAFDVSGMGGATNLFTGGAAGGSGLAEEIAALTGSGVATPGSGGSMWDFGDFLNSIGIDPSSGVDMTGFMNDPFSFTPDPTLQYGNLSGYNVGDLTNSMMPGGSLSASGNGMIDLGVGTTGAIPGVDLSAGGSILSQITNTLKTLKSLGLPGDAASLSQLLFGSKGISGALGLGDNGLLGGAISTAARMAPGLAALEYAKSQPGIDTGQLEGILGQLGGNQDAIIKAATDPLQQNIAGGYGDLLQSQAARGIRGSSFGDTDIANYISNTGRAVANAGANAAEGSLALQGNLAGNIASLKNTAQQIKNSLYGRAFDVLGRGLNPSPSFSIGRA